jgi:hypothetical protein
MAQSLSAMHLMKCDFPAPGEKFRVAEILGFHEWLSHAACTHVAKPFEANIQRLQTIAGAGRRTADVGV